MAKKIITGHDEERNNDIESYRKRLHERASYDEMRKSMEPVESAKGYTARAMVLASMPHSKPEETYFERKNGNYTLTMQASHKIGLPYGSIPRLLLAWITTEAVRTKSRELVLGSSLAEFMRKLDIKRTGGKNGRISALHEQMLRLFTTSINCTYSDEERVAGVNMFVADKYELWWNPKTNSNAEQKTLWESTIVLSESFYNEVITNPIVFYMDVLKGLRKSPLALDIYMWLTHKNSYSKNSFMIPWEKLQAQFGVGYPNDAQGKSDFKQNYKKALKKVSEVYPEAKKLIISKEGLIFYPGSPHVPKTKK